MLRQFFGPLGIALLAAALGSLGRMIGRPHRGGIEVQPESAGLVRVK